ncbi:MAG: hypothetical protein HYR66_17015 [Sphingobacteriales bacterium]|nr:hypothetical protein [Sphingobacteriales bacterium]MBI3717021.1 hypothetical protein [Sphingobacteriales bacterium]
MKDLHINISENLDGVVFGLSVATRMEIKKEVPGAIPVARIFVAYDTKSDFESYHGKIEKQIVPALTGVDLSAIQKHFRKIVFINTETNEKYQLDATLV